MIIFINNKTTKFCQITLRVLKDLFIKEKWFLVLPRGVETLPIRIKAFKSFGTLCCTG